MKITYIYHEYDYDIWHCFTYYTNTFHIHHYYRQLISTTHHHGILVIVCLLLVSEPTILPWIINLSTESQPICGFSLRRWLNWIPQIGAIRCPEQFKKKNTSYIILPWQKSFGIFSFYYEVWMQLVFQTASLHFQLFSVTWHVFFERPWCRPSKRINQQGNNFAVVQSHEEKTLRTAFGRTKIAYSWPSKVVIVIESYGVDNFSYSYEPWFIHASLFSTVVSQSTLLTF